MRWVIRGIVSKTGRTGAWTVEAANQAEAERKAAAKGVNVLAAELHASEANVAEAHAPKPGGRTQETTRAQSTAAPPPRFQRRNRGGSRFWMAVTAGVIVAVAGVIFLLTRGPDEQPVPSTAVQLEGMPGWKAVSRGKASVTAEVRGPTIKLRINEVDGSPTHALLLRDGLKLFDGRSYVLRFRARSDTVRKMTVMVSATGSAARDRWLNEEISLGTQWKTTQLVFTASPPKRARSRLSFFVGQKKGVIELSNLTLSPKGSQRNLAYEPP